MPPPLEDIREFLEQYPEQVHYLFGCALCDAGFRDLGDLLLHVEEHSQHRPGGVEYSQRLPRS